MMPQITPIDGGEQGRGGEVGAVAVVVFETIGFESFLSGQEAGSELGQTRYAVLVFGRSADFYYFGIGFPEVGYEEGGQDEGAQDGGHENKDQEDVDDDGVAQGLFQDGRCLLKAGSGGGGFTAGSGGGGPGGPRIRNRRGKCPRRRAW